MERLTRRVARVVTAGLLVAGTGALACNRPTPVPVGTEVAVAGIVRHVDTEPMTRDGDGRIQVNDDQTGRWILLVPARERTCNASGLNVVHAVSPGDWIEARGTVHRARELQICDATHYLRKPSPSHP